MCWLLWALVIVWSSLNQTTEGCNYTYVTQPPSSLGCNPLGIQLKLFCATDPLPQSATLNWYWTQNVSDAGVNGTPILPGDTYMVTATAQTFVQRDLRFIVTNSTIGYYWCEIGNVTDVLLRPTTITPVCSTGSSQLMNCNNTDIANMHDMPMCAVINSPFSPSPLPAPCSASLQISTNSTTLFLSNTSFLQLSMTTTSIQSTIPATLLFDTNASFAFSTSTASKSLQSSITATSVVIASETSLNSISATSDSFSTNKTLTSTVSNSTMNSSYAIALTMTTSHSSSSFYLSTTPSLSSNTVPDITILPWVIAFGCIVSVAFIVFLVASFILLVYKTKRRRRKESDSFVDNRPTAVSRENLLGSVTQLNESFSNDESTPARNNAVVHLGLQAHQALDNPLYSETPLGMRPLLTQKVECDTQQEEFVNSERTANNGVQHPNQLSLDNPVYYKPEVTMEDIDGDHYSVVKNSDRQQLDNHLSLAQTENHYQEVESPYLSPVSLNERRPLLTRACSPYLAPTPLHEMNNAAQLPAASDENCYAQVHVVTTCSTIPPILVSPYEVPVEKKEDAVYDVLNEKL